MFESIKIENYKAFSSLEVDGLRRINIFMGGNNSGKSCLLEAVSLLAEISYSSILYRRNADRDFNKIGDFAYFFNNMDTNHSIVISATGEPEVDWTRRLEMLMERYSDERGHSWVSRNTLQLKRSVGGRELFDGSWDLVFDESSCDEEEASTDIMGHGYRNSMEGYFEQLDCAFIPQKYAMTNETDNAEELLAENRERELLEGLRIIEPRIKDFVVVKGDVLVNVGLGKRLPLNLMGDGVRRLFVILAEIIDCENGVLLADEIDNGLHHSVMHKAWQAIAQMAEKHNVQIFATTHSMDTLKGIKEGFDKEKGDELFTFCALLKKDSGDNMAFPLSYSELSSDIDMGNDFR